jgi:hypothetical protein
MYVRLRLKTLDGKAETMYMRVLSVSPEGTYFGFNIDRNTLNEKACYEKDGVIHETKQLVHHSAIVKVTPLYEDIRYGGLTTVDVPAQKLKYGL